MTGRVQPEKEVLHTHWHSVIGSLRARRYIKEYCKTHLKIFVFLYTSSGFEDEMYTAIADGNSSTSCLAKAILLFKKCGKIMAMFNGM